MPSWRLVVVVALAGLAGSCVKTKEEPVGALADGCLLNSDCTAPLVCAFRRCHNACDSDRDCPGGLHCRNVDKPFNVCLLDDELRCPNGTDRECPGLMLCGPDLLCRDPCKSDRDCLKEQVCTRGVCATVTELSNGELPRVVDAGPPPCLYTSQCDPPLVCRGTCVRECLTDRDCALGSNCESGVCVRVDLPVPDGGVPPGFGARCTINSDCLSGLRCGPGGFCTVDCVTARDCDTGFNECCVANQCRRGVECSLMPWDAGSGDGGAWECRADLDCASPLRCDAPRSCVDHRCVSSTRGPCDDGNPCTVDLCSEATGCSYMTRFPPDEDGDGHYPSACGGNADDCDDRNPTVFRGAPERCDFVDNDCNGQIDEDRWRPDLSTRAAISAGGLYPGNAGAPRALRVGGDVLIAAASDATTRGSVDVWRVDPVTLSTSLGPVPVGASRTTWDRCVYLGSPFPGRRVTVGGLAVADDGGLAISGLEGTYQTSMCCEPGTYPVSTGFLGRWSLQQNLDAGVLSAAPIIANGCNGQLNFYERGLETAGVAWAPALGQYVAAWGEKNQSTGIYNVLFSTMDAWTGAVSPPRQVVQAGSGILGSELLWNSSTRGGVVVASGPPGVLIAWMQNPGGSYQLRYVLMNPTLTQRLVGPTVFGLPNNLAVPLWATWDGTGFTMLVQAGNGGALALLGISATGAPAWGPRVLPPASSWVNNEGISAGVQSSAALVDGGVFVAETRANLLTVSWGARAADAGFMSVDFDTGRSQGAHSDPALVPLDDRRVLLIWADGDLQKVLLRCVE